MFIKINPQKTKSLTLHYQAISECFNGDHHLEILPNCGRVQSSHMKHISIALPLKFALAWRDMQGKMYGTSREGW